MRGASLALLLGTLAACPRPSGLALREGALSPLTRELDALWYRDEPDKTRSHGTTRIRATLLPNQNHHVRVGVLEEYYGATGAEWRSSVWLASFIASASLGTELTAFRYDISCDGFIDGPSAGALMAVGFMAAMTGARILPEASMTGALAPDGSVVAVNGIPEKIVAAKAIGKKRIGVPAGQALATSAGGAQVDVIALGKKLGVEVREIADVYDAYALLTGRTLTRPMPAPASQMAIGAAFGKLLRERAATLLDQAEADIALVSGETAANVGRVAALARRAVVSSRAHLAGDGPSAAYLRASRAASHARGAVRMAALTSKEKYAARAGSLEESAQRIDELERKLAAAAAVRGGASPFVLAAGYGAAARARGFLQVVRSSLARSVATAQGEVTGDKAVMRAVLDSGHAHLPALYMSYADLAVDLGGALLSEGGSLSSPLVIHGESLQRVSRGFASAATGNLGYIDALLLTQVAADKKMTLDAVRSAFALNERSYLLALHLAQLAMGKVKDTGASIGQQMSRLFSAVNSYIESALVVTKYYSLDADPTKGDEVVRRDRALASLLERAELSSRAAAAQAQARLGTVPREAKLHYQAAKAELVKPGIRNKLRALRSFWRAHAVSRVASLIMKKGGAR